MILVRGYIKTDLRDLKTLTGIESRWVLTIFNLDIDLSNSASDTGKKKNECGFGLPDEKIF